METAVFLFKPNRSSDCKYLFFILIVSLPVSSVLLLSSRPTRHLDVACYAFGKDVMRAVR